MSRQDLLFAFCALVLWVHAASAQPVDTPAPDVLSPPGKASVLRVLVEGVRSGEGHVRIDACARGEFLKECRYAGASSAKPGVTEVDLSGLPPGVYAVQAYHDRNDNMEVDRNFLGFPTELVGFSNNAPTRLGPPSFKDAAFSYEGGDKTIRLRLRRLRP